MRYSDNNRGAQSGAGACTQSELNLNGCTFDGSDKTNIYKERHAIVQTDGVADNSSQASSNNSSDQGQSHGKKPPTRPRRPSNDEIYQMIRRFHP